MIAHDEQYADRPQPVDVILIFQGRFHPMRTNTSVSPAAVTVARLGLTLDQSSNREPRVLAKPKYRYHAKEGESSTVQFQQAG